MIDIQVKNSIIQTYTGRHIDPINPNPEDIHIKDIAHSLSMTCRYGGQCLRFYSVAEHSVILSKLVEDLISPEYALMALLHDASEAYLVDMPRPIKYVMPEYMAIEENLMKVICQKFSLMWPMSHDIHTLDQRICGNEIKQNMRHDTKKYESIKGVRLKYWYPKKAEKMFMRRYRELTNTPTFFEKHILYPTKSFFSLGFNNL